jgi:hypothetical protein
MRRRGPAGGRPGPTQSRSSPYTGGTGLLLGTVSNAGGGSPRPCQAVRIVVRGWKPRARRRPTGRGWASWATLRATTPITIAISENAIAAPERRSPRVTRQRRHGAQRHGRRTSPDPADSWQILSSGPRTAQALPGRVSGPVRSHLGPKWTLALRPRRQRPGQEGCAARDLNPQPAD